MILSTNSNTINALGIFGRLEPEQEKYFKQLQDKYSQLPKNDESIGIFNHLSLVINRNVPVGKNTSISGFIKRIKTVFAF